ncbi:hypothetical protein CR513_49449, partial [Mucuna pruriens]
IRRDDLGQHEKSWLKRVVPARLTRPRIGRLCRSSSHMVHTSPQGAVQWHCPQTKKPKIVREDRLDYQRTLVDPILSNLANGVYLIHIETTKNGVYQIGAVVEDTSSFVSLCAKPEMKPNPELRKARNIVVSNSSNSDSVSSFDNSSPITNTFDFVEYCSTNSFAK